MNLRRNDYKSLLKVSNISLPLLLFHGIDLLVTIVTVILLWYEKQTFSEVLEVTAALVLF